MVYMSTFIFINLTFMCTNLIQSRIISFLVLRSVDECNEDDDLAKSSPIEARESGNERETTRIDETLDDNRFRGKPGY